VESIVSGENDRKITYVTSEGQEGVTGILMDELSEIASTLVTRSQSAVYGMQNIMWKNGMGDNIKDAELDISKKYIAMLLKRTKLCEVEDIGVANDLSISLEEFYACSLTLFLILIFGINSSYLFSHRNNELSKFMASRNVGVIKQILSEYFSYVCLLSACVVGIFVLAGINILPVIAMFAAIQNFIYELVDSVVGSILLQFICSISMAYVSGYFYPERFFPEGVKRIGEALPTGVALKYANGIVIGEFDYRSLAGIVVYGLVFVVLSIFIRKHRIERG
jgi:ABC-2 type transport system permease protein